MSFEFKNTDEFLLRYFPDLELINNAIGYLN